MKLLIGNKNYSSWSMRPWLVLKHFNIDFVEEMLLLNGPGWKANLLAKTPAGFVPVLKDGGLVLGETIAIIEYLADRFPQKQIWPGDMNDRALARSAVAEMHAGFFALRSAAPMNLRAALAGRVAHKDVAADLERLETLLGGFLARSGGPFLFGGFGAPDAMFAPVAARVKTYDLPVSDLLKTYFAFIFALDAYQAWLADALKESWIVNQDEVDITQA